MNKFIKAMIEGKSTIYASIAEAARALRIDASNIGKVLRGKRPTAGGFKFSYTLETPTTRAGRATMKSRIERAEHREAVNAVHDRLKEINQRYRNALKEKVYTDDPVLQKLMSHTDYFGATKTGGYNISSSNLNKFTTSELQNLLKVLGSEEKKYIKIAETKKRGHGRAELAAILGISENQVSEYDDLIPAAFELMRLSNEDSFFRYSETRDALFESFQAGLDHEKIEGYIDSIYEAYLGNDIAALGNILAEMANVDEAYRDPFD